MYMTEHDKTRAAAEYVDAKIGFYIHFVVYLLVIALLFAADYRSPDEWWVQWPALGWGIGVLGHAFGVFGTASRSFQRWRLRRIERARAQI